MHAWFGDGWTVGPKTNVFTEQAGGGPGAGPVPVSLPHDVQLGLTRDPSAAPAAGYFPGGVWTYEKRFAVPAEWHDRRIRLRFEGVYRDAMVFVNRDFATSHAYGYGEFEVLLDPFLRFGEENVVTVECRTHDDSRWYSGAGIYRPVHLFVQSPVHLAIDGVWVTTPEIDDDGAVIAVTSELQNESHHTETVRVRHEVVSPSGHVVATVSVPVTVLPGEEVVDVQRMHVERPLRWSTETPHLHTCRTTISSVEGEVLEQHEVAFGVRRLQLDPRHGLRIDGVPVKLRGACVHHDNGPLGAATFGRAEERRVERLKAAGFNAIRSAHNPLSRSMLDACDRLGVLVMDEAWDMWNENKRDHDHALRFSQTWRDDLRGMVRKDRNHPSVVMYSIGNEIPEVGSVHGAALARKLGAEVRHLDPTRYVVDAVQPLLAIRDMLDAIREQAGLMQDELQALGVNSMMKAWVLIKDRLLKSEKVGELTEQVFAGADIAGYNYLEPRYLIDSGLHPNRMIVGSETYVTEFDKNWAVILQHPQLLGDFTWTGWEYLGEVGIGRTTFDDDNVGGASVVGPFPWLVSGTGDIDVVGERRPQSYFREIVTGLRAAPYIASHRPEHFGTDPTYQGPWSWPYVVHGWSWPTADGAPVRVDVYSAADEVELLVNGVSAGRAPAGPEHRYTASFDATYAQGEVTAVAYTDGVETGRDRIASTVGTIRLQGVAERASIGTAPDDLGFVSITFADESGTVDHLAAHEFTVVVDGPGVLQGLASANPMAAHPYTGAACAAHEGRALAVVRPTGAGVITVTVTADGFPAASVTIEAVTG